MMQSQTVTAHVTQISEVTIEFMEKMRTLRDPKTLELPNNFMNELYKWSLECKYIHICVCEYIYAIDICPLQKKILYTHIYKRAINH